MAQGRRVLKDGFTGLAAIVTGAAQGIGRAIAEELYAQGANMVLVDCTLEGVVATKEWLCKAGLAAVDFVVADLSDPLVIPILTAQVAALRPKIDVLVNNAGIEVDLPFIHLTAEVFDRVMAVNLSAPLLVSKELASLFPDSGGHRKHQLHSCKSCLSKLHSLCLLQGRDDGAEQKYGAGIGLPAHSRQRRLSGIYRYADVG